MANLIITIISIALVAVAAIMGAIYVGTALQNAQPKAWGNAVMSQDQQLLAAFNLWSSNNGGADFTHVGFSDFINQGYLSTWPELAMLAPQPGTGSVSNSYDDESQGAMPPCPAINGYRGWVRRMGATYNGTNFIAIWMFLNDPYDGTCTFERNAGNGYGFEDARYSGHPYVQLANALNKITGAVPTSATISGSGLPYALSGAGFPNANSEGTNQSVQVDSSGKLQLNYCYLFPMSGNGITGVTTIMCNFSQ